MKGLQLLLQSLGIKIDPAQVEQAFECGKTALPEIAQAFQELKASQARCEAKLDKIIAQLAATDDFNESEARQIRALNSEAGHA